MLPMLENNRPKAANVLVLRPSKRPSTPKNLQAYWIEAKAPAVILVLCQRGTADMGRARRRSCWKRQRKNCGRISIQVSHRRKTKYQSI